MLGKRTSDDYQFQMVIHENTHMSIIIQTEEDVLTHIKLYLYTYSCVYIKKLIIHMKVKGQKKEAIDLKESKEDGLSENLKGRKGKREMI